MEIHSRLQFEKLFLHYPTTLIKHLGLVDFNYNIIIIENITEKIMLKLECGTQHISIYKANVFVSYNGCKLPCIIRSLYTHKIYEEDIVIRFVDNLNYCIHKYKLLTYTDNLCTDVINLILHYYSELLAIDY